MDPKDSRSDHLNGLISGLPYSGYNGREGVAPARGHAARNRGSAARRVSPFRPPLSP
jgi:hypothetical protein